MRCIVHIDVDCFYCQVEQNRLGIFGIPLAVQQWRSLIAVNYEARASGISRHDSVLDARKKCPELVLVHVATYSQGSTTPEYHENPNPRTHKVCLDFYRQKSQQIFEIVGRFAVMEKTSIDECYLDVSVSQSCTVWPPEAGMLLGDLAEEKESFFGAANLVREIRETVFRELNITLSAGIAPNKTLAKLCSAMYKPNRQTTLPLSNVLDFLSNVPFSKIRLLGGKLGESIESVFKVKTCGELRSCSLEQLTLTFGPEAPWIYDICRGICHAKVVPKSLPKSMMAAKASNVKNAMELEKWMCILFSEITLRVNGDHEINKRWPRTLVLHLKTSNGDISKSFPFPSKSGFPDSNLFCAKLVSQLTNDIYPCSRVAIQCQGFQALQLSLDKWLTSKPKPKEKIKEKEKKKAKITDYFAKK